MQPAPVQAQPAIPVRMGATRWHLRYATGWVHLTRPYKTRVRTPASDLTPDDLRFIRKLLGTATVSMSQRRFGWLIGHPLGTVQKWEYGKRRVSMASEANILALLASRRIEWPYVDRGPVMDFSDQPYFEQRV